jgi:hypothetical protein
MDDGHGERVRADRALAAVRPGGLRVRSGTGAVVTLPNPALDAFEAECEALAADLDAAVEHAGLSRDPYRHLIEAQARMVRFYPRMVRMMQRASGSALPAELVAEMERQSREGAEAGAAAVLRREAGQVVQRLDRARAMATGIAIGAAFALGGLVVFAAVAFGVLR